MSDTQALTLLLAATATPGTAALDKAAHALGWPDHYQLRDGKPPRGGISTLHKAPRRNYYFGHAMDKDWHALRHFGLATYEAKHEGCGLIGEPEAEGRCWIVTPLGIEAIRLRLIAAYHAARVRKAALSPPVTTRPEVSGGAVGEKAPGYLSGKEPA